MRKDYAFTPQQLNDYIQDTVRVFDEYRLDKKIYANSTYKILAPTKGIFIQYQFFTTETGCQLSIAVGALSGKITEQNALAWANVFINQVDKIINRQILLTPEIANRDVYKSGQTTTGVIKLISLIAAIIAILYSFYVLMS